MSEPKPVQLHVRLFPGEDDDLIAWYESLDVPHGRKAQRIRDALRQGIGAEAGELDERVKAAIREALATHTRQSQPPED
jgi:hypothetical protein